MAQMVTLPQTHVYKLLEDQGLFQTDMGDQFNKIWCDKKTGQYYTVPVHEGYPPSIVSDMLEKFSGKTDSQILDLIDEHVYSVHNH